MRKLKINKEEPLKTELSHFVKCVQGKEKPVISIEESIWAIQVAEAMKRSSKEGKVVCVD
jgi:predicted dehydrogenase